MNKKVGKEEKRMKVFGVKKRKGVRKENKKQTKVRGKGEKNTKEDSKKDKTGKKEK